MASLKSVIFLISFHPVFVSCYRSGIPYTISNHHYHRSPERSVEGLTPNFNIDSSIIPVKTTNA